ncbi:ATP-grasp domain-containing protein [Adlercreutzia sp. ZJ138]|uniref:ATP-grasp domain-containing protein n=1 Tax=Adlercreutzia sp. ZJ138 TaxID=2709405 RepID=UPI0013EBE7D8|nr:ATP-grasp domain-containing protein [Adlercreutzia sp. ZJ138]
MTHGQQGICAVIGAGSESLHAIKLAQRRGLRVVGLDSDPKAEGLTAVDDPVVVDIRDAEVVMEALRERSVSFLLPVPIGRWVLTAGTVNDGMGMKGVGAQAVERCVDKYLFHRVMASKGLRDGECFLVDEGTCLPSPAVYPIIMKPRFGSGSRSVFVAESAEQMASFASNLDFDEDYVFETAAPGTEYGLDAAVVCDALHIILLREKINTAPPARQCVGYFAVPHQEKTLYRRVEGFMEAAVAALGLRDCLLHADLMVCDDEVFPIEISPRPSGHMLSSVFTPAATGVLPVEQYLNYQMGQSFSFDPEGINLLLIRYFDFGECEVIAVPGEEQIASFGGAVVDYRCSIKPGDRLCKVVDGHSVMGRGYVIIQGPTKQQMMSIAEELFALFERKPLWTKE